VGVRIVCVCNLWLLKREREKRFKKCIRRDRERETEREREIERGLLR
jgi:hypothetical protein